MQLEPSEITALREGLKMSKPELSRALGLQEDACRAWENGNKRCSGTSALALALYARLSKSRYGRAILKEVAEL